MIANNPGFAPYQKDCKLKRFNNAYICHKEHLTIMTFESEDSDKKDRAMQPIYINLEGTKQANKLNAMMDHAWDGFYTS